MRRGIGVPRRRVLHGGRSDYDLDLANFKGNEKKRNKEEECFGWWKSENETELE